MMINRKANSIRFLHVAMLTSSAIFASHSATAQTQEGEENRLDEIVVTARRTAEDVQDIPLTVNVISGEDLDKKGIGQLSNVAGFVSNLVWVDGGGGTFSNQITLRGIYSNATSQGFDPGVAMYVDDVYVGNQFAFNTALLDVDRIEVLKGPQGTLFGRNAAAGAISVHTRKPDINDFALVTDARLGNIGLIQNRLLVNIPVSDVMAVKFSGIYRDRDGYQRNVLTGQRSLNDEHFFGGKVQVLLSPTPKLDLLATAEYFENDDHQGVLSCLETVGKLPCPNPTVASVFANVAADNGSTTWRRNWGASLKAEWRAPSGLDVTSITAYRDLRVLQDQDQDYTTLDFVRSGFAVPEDWQFSQELRVATNQAARLRGVAGLYYYQEARTTNIPLLLTPPLIGLLGGNATQNVIQTTHSELRTKSYAAFGQAQFDLTPNLVVEAGLRYTIDKKHFAYEQTLTPNFTDVPAPIRDAISMVTVPRGTSSESFNKLTYTGSLSWKPMETVLTYVRYSTGFKAGGFQAATFSHLYNPFVPFQAENSAQIEVGAKTELANGRFRFNVAAFSTNYEDIQVQITNLNLEKIVGNFGSARARGIEIEASARLARGLSLDGNVGFQRSRFRSGPFDGRSFQFVPSRTASISANYETGVANGWIGVANASASYRSAMNLSTDDPNDPTSGFWRSPSVVLVNARIGIEQEKDGFGIYLWGNNLTNEQRITQYGPAGLLQPRTFMITAPRTYGVEVKVAF